MESNKSKGNNRRGNNRRKNGGNKENKREIEKMKKSRSEESVLWSFNNESGMEIAEQMTSLNLENFDNGGENNPKPSLMCPALRRQLQTHRNVLRLLHEHKLASTQINGQRILSIQPIRWTGPTPGIDCEVFVGRIPKTIYEDVLYPLFNTIGEVFQIRLMVDMAELTRGYCFIMYTNPENAKRAIVQLDQYEILPGKNIRVLASVNKCKLYIGPLPWHIASEEVVRVIYASAWDIEYVSIYRFPNHDAAYAIVSFKSHRNAALARRKLRPEKLFKCNEVHVEWARIDWNPSNVYEDRGTVDDKGDVHIVRKYLQEQKIQSKKTSSSTLSESSSNHSSSLKQLPPICPPSSSSSSSSFDGTNPDGDPNPFVIKSNQNFLTRHATMHANMSETMLNDLTKTSSRDKKKMETSLTDINDNNVQLLDFVKDQCTRTIDVDATSNDSFRNFDMWNSNFMSQLPGSPENSGSSFKESSSNTTCKSGRNDWDRYDKDAQRYSKTTLNKNIDNRYNSSNTLVRYPCHNSRSFNKTIDRWNQTIAVTDPVQCHQTVPVYLQNHATASCYVLLQPQNNYLCPKDAIVIYPQSSFVDNNNGIINPDEGTRVPLLTMSNYDHQSIVYNGNHQVMQSSIATDKDFIHVDDDNEFRREKVSTKSETLHLASGHQNHHQSSNVMLNYTPIYGTSENEKSGKTPCFVSTFDTMNGNNENHPRPILKQTTIDHAWL